jgi:hypothetical protein
MTVSVAQDLLRRFGDSIDFNQAFVIVAAFGLDVNVHPIGEAWECYVIGRDGPNRANGTTPLAAIREALNMHFLGG